MSLVPSAVTPNLRPRGLSRPAHCHLAGDPGSPLALNWSARHARLTSRIHNQLAVARPAPPTPQLCCASCSSSRPGARSLGHSHRRRDHLPEG